MPLVDNKIVCDSCNKVIPLLIIGRRGISAFLQEATFICGDCKAADLMPQLPTDDLAPRINR